MAQFDTWEKNQHKKGFGLVELIVVAALFSFIMLTLAAFMVNLQGSANNVKFRADGDTFNDEIRALLS